MKNNSFSLTILALGCAVATSASAQSSGTGLLASGVSSSGAFEPKPVAKVGGFAITPTVTTVIGRDSNITLQPKATEVGSSFVAVAPQVVAEAAYRADRYKLAYNGEFKRFKSYSAADTNNHELSAEGWNVFTARAAMSWRLAVADAYDPLGTDISRRNVPLNASPDKYTSRYAFGLFGFGTEEAQGRIEAGALFYSRRYEVNKSTGSNQTKLDSDKDSRELIGRFFYRLAPSTRAVVEYRHGQNDYVYQALDNTDQRVLVGVTWDATAATSGSVKVGRQRKSFDDRTGQDFSGASWEGSVRWEPLTYTAFDLTVNRAAGDPTPYDGSYLMGTTGSIGWTHKWASYLESNVVYGRTTNKYVNRPTFPRDDTLDTVGVGLKYTFRSWLRAGLAYEYSNRDSTDNFYDYKRNLVTARAEIGF